VFFSSSQVVDFMERETGIEPATSSLGSWHSTAELLPHSGDSVIYLIPRHLPVSRTGLFRPWCLLNLPIPT
jgi:hypothetical protein